MFKKIEKGLGTYKEELRKYFKCVEELKKEYGNKDCLGCWSEQITIGLRQIQLHCEVWKEFLAYLKKK